MDRNTNYYSPLATKKSRTYSMDENTSPSLKDSIQDYQLLSRKANKSADCATRLTKKKSSHYRVESSSKKEVENIISSIRKPSSDNDIPSSLFIPDEKEILTSKSHKKSRKRRKSKNSRNNSTQKLNFDDNIPSEIVNGNCSSQKKDVDEVKEVLDELNKENEKIIDRRNSNKSVKSKNRKSSENIRNSLSKIEEEKIKIPDGHICKSKVVVEEPESLSNDNTLTTVSQEEDKSDVNGSRIGNGSELYESSSVDAYNSLTSNVSSYVDDEDEVDSTLSNNSYNDGTISSRESKKTTSIVKGGVRKMRSLRRKYLSRPIKYSVSSVFKYGVGALSSLLNLRVDDVFGIEEYNKEVLKEATLKGVADYIKSGKAKNIIIFSGAGISTNAGIPDFRSPKTGLYSNLKKYKLPYPEAIFTLEYFKINPEPFYHMARQFYPGYYKPTITHYFIKELQNRQLLLRDYTQNIDALERICGIYDDKIVEAHGSFNSAYCIGTKDKPGCRKVYDYKWLYSRLFPINKEFVIPRCERCNGLVKPAISFFGEPVPDRVSECAKEDFAKCDLLMVIGTSLKVEPLSRMVNEVAINVPRLLINKTIVNAFDNDRPRRRSSSSYNLDHFDIFYDPEELEVPINRDVVALGDCDDVCLKLAGYLGFRNQLIETFNKENERLAQEIELDPTIVREIEEYNSPTTKSLSPNSPNSLSSINENSTLAISTTVLNSPSEVDNKSAGISSFSSPNSMMTAIGNSSMYSATSSNGSLLTDSSHQLSPQGKKANGVDVEPSDEVLYSSTDMSLDSIKFNINTQSNEKRESNKSGLTINTNSTILDHSEKVKKDKGKGKCNSLNNIDNLQENDSVVVNRSSFSSTSIVESSIDSTVNSSTPSSSIPSYSSLSTISPTTNEQSQSPSYNNKKILRTTNSYHNSLDPKQQHDNNVFEFEFEFDIEGTMNNIKNSVSNTISNTQNAISTALANSTAFANSTALRETLNDIKRNSIQTIIDTKNLIINNNAIKETSDNTTQFIKNVIRNVERRMSVSSTATDYEDCLSKEEEEEEGALNENKAKKGHDSGNPSEKKMNSSINEGIPTPASMATPQSQPISITHSKDEHATNILPMNMCLSPSNSIRLDEEQIKEKEEEEETRFFSIPMD